MGMKQILKKTFFYKFYRLLRSNPSEKFDKKSKKNLEKNGMKYLELLENILNENGIKHFFDFGTLLGIVRDSGIIKGDGDIDIGVFIDNEESIKRIKKLLENKKIKKLRQFEIDEYGISEQSYSYKNEIRFDLHYYYRDNSSRYCFLFYCLPNKEYKPSEFDVVKVKLKDFNIQENIVCNLTLSLPENPEEVIIQKYGESWRIPDSSWPYWEGPCSEKTNLIGKTTLFIK